MPQAFHPTVLHLHPAQPQSQSARPAGSGTERRCGRPRAKTSCPCSLVRGRLHAAAGCPIWDSTSCPFDASTGEAQEPRAPNLRTPLTTQPPESAPHQSSVHIFTFSSGFKTASRIFFLPFGHFFLQSPHSLGQGGTSMLLNLAPRLRLGCWTWQGHAGSTL